jgi:hypothetical protein
MPSPSLPARIHDLVQSLGLDSANMVAVLKTAYKPNATIPIIWAALFEERLLLCSTHRTRGVWRDYNPESFDTARVTRGSTRLLTLEILGKGREGGILELPLPPACTSEEASTFATTVNRELHKPAKA